MVRNHELAAVLIDAIQRKREAIERAQAEIINLIEELKEIGGEGPSPEQEMPKE